MNACTSVLAASVEREFKLKINWSSPENTMFIVKKPGASKCVF
jgi:hypothetical protein